MSVYESISILEKLMQNQQKNPINYCIKIKIRLEQSRDCIWYHATYIVLI